MRWKLDFTIQVRCIIFNMHHLVPQSHSVPISSYLNEPYQAGPTTVRLLLLQQELKSPPLHRIFAYLRHFICSRWTNKAGDSLHWRKWCKSTFTRDEFTRLTARGLQDPSCKDLHDPTSLEVGHKSWGEVTKWYHQLNDMRIKKQGTQPYDFVYHK